MIFNSESELFSTSQPISFMLTQALKGQKCCAVMKTKSHRIMELLFVYNTKPAFRTHIQLLLFSRQPIPKAYLTAEKQSTQKALPKRKSIMINFYALPGQAITHRTSI